MMKKLIVVALSVLLFASFAHGQTSPSDRTAKKAAYHKALTELDKLKGPWEAKRQRLDALKALKCQWLEIEKEITKAKLEAENEQVKCSEAQSDLATPLGKDPKALLVKYEKCLGKLAEKTAQLTAALNKAKYFRRSVGLSLQDELFRYDGPSMNQLIEEKIHEHDTEIASLEVELANKPIELIDAETAFKEAAEAWYRVSEVESLDVTARETAGIHEKLVLIDSSLKRIVESMALTRLQSAAEADDMAEILNRAITALEKGSRSPAEVQRVLVETQKCVTPCYNGGYKIEFCNGRYRRCR